MKTTGATTSIFDLDGVLTRADTMTALVSSRLASRPHRLLPALPLFLIASLSSPDGPLRPAMNRRLVGLALRGMNRDEKLAHRIGQTLAAASTVVRQAVGACEAAYLHGLTVVAAASEATVARAFLDGVGLHDVPLVASRLEYTDRGPRLASHNVGTAKLAAVRRAGFAPEDAIFYTDSASDIPLARAAQHTVVVNANARSVRKLAASTSQTTCERWK